MVRSLRQGSPRAIIPENFSPNAQCDFLFLFKSTIQNQQSSIENPFESLHLSEKVATDFVQEVAEWSVLDAKELVEP
ncbi:MAG: hypothetical protein H7Y36_00545 [Armatimonadetes bacterium]|nr:hypothetical protein [Akkermansiaceae bacterium]